MKPNIKDVARKAGVSVATVSRVLNDQPGYTAETKQKVLRVINEIGYKPNALARGLVSKKTRTMGVLLPNLTSNFMLQLLDGVENAARTINYSVIICPTGDGGKDTLKYLQVLGEQQVGGIIIASEWVKDEYAEVLFEMNIPVVLVSTMSERYQIPYIKVDDKQAAYRATKYLIDKGHQKIGLLSGTKEDPIAGIPRIEGYRQALKDFGLPFAEENLVCGNFGYKSGISCMELLLKNSPNITAVFATSDEMAAGVLSYAYQHSIKVPDEISVIGYDDTQLAEMTAPPLTCVHQPIYEMGRKAVNMLLESKGTAESVIMPYHIVERDSVKKIN